MHRRRNLICVALLTTSICALGAGLALLQNQATAQQAMVDVPMFEVDPMWPKPIPDERLLGMTSGPRSIWQDNSGSSTAAARLCTTTRRAPSSIRRPRPAAEVQRRYLRSIPMAT